MTPTPRRPYPIRKAVITISSALPLGWLVGQVLKDRFLPLNLFFYLPPLLCFTAGLLSFLMLKNAARKLRFLLLGIGLLALGDFFFVDIKFNPTNTHMEGVSYRLVHWNTSHGRFGPERITTVLSQTHSDFFLLSEAPPDLDIQKMVRSILPNGYWFRTDEMAILSRFPIKTVERLDLMDGYSWRARIQTPVSILDLLAVDLRANLFVSREPDLKTLSDWIEKQDPNHPLIVVGDFNTPRDSVHFEGFRRSLKNAYEEVGHGWPYSWPLPLPILQIDHIWVGEKIQPFDHRYSFALGSDHLLQELGFEIQP